MTTKQFQRGNLQDAINANVVNRTSFSEKEMLRLFKGTCDAVRAMHDYRPSLHPRNNTRLSSAIPASALPTSTPTSTGRPPKSSKGKRRADNDDYDDNDERFPQPDGDADDGYSYDRENEFKVPLVTKNEPDIVFDGDEELDRLQSNEGNGQRPEDEMVHVPYAHRDLKPG